MSTHNISFYEDLTKIIFEISSNMHLIFCYMGRLICSFVVCSCLKQVFPCCCSFEKIFEMCFTKITFGRSLQYKYKITEQE